MAKKEYELIDELKDAEDMAPLLKAGDMRGGSGPISWPRMVFCHFLFAPLGLMSLGLIIYKVFFAMSSPSLWLNIPFGIACVYMFWVFLKWCIYTYIQVKSGANQFYEWRPHGAYLMWFNKGYVREEGKATFSCSHCHQRKHSFTLSLRRENIATISYVPTFFDPLFPMDIKYNRVVLLPVSCPLTGRALDGRLNIKQTSHNPVTEINIVGP